MRIGAASIKFRHDGAISGRSVSIGVRLASNVSGFVSGVTLHAKVKRVPERERERPDDCKHGEEETCGMMGSANNSNLGHLVI